MKVLFMHNTLPEYRIEWFLEMQKLADIDFVFTNEKEIYRNYKIEIEKTRLPDSIFLSSGRAGFYELAEILKDDYDVIELPPVDTIHEYCMSKMAVIAAKKKRCKLAFFWEKWEAPKEKQPLKRKIKNMILGMAAKNVYKDVDIIFAGSSSCKKYFLERGVDEKKITILPDSSIVPDCPYEDIRYKYKIGEDKKLLLYFGRLMPEKGLGYLLEVMTYLDDSYHLLVAGGGELQEAFVKQAEKLKLQNITFAGPIDPNVRKNYFEQCDVFVFPGTWMGGCVDVWGLTNNEAIQFSRPIVSTYAVGSAIDLIKNGVNGYIIEPENTVALRTAIERIDDFDMEKLIEKDRELKDKYSAREMAKVYFTALTAISDSNMK